MVPKPCGVRLHEDGPLLFEPRELYDAAILGAARRPGDVLSVVVYDAEKLVEVLVGCGMEYEDALEHVAFNMEGSWLGPGTPLVLRRIPEHELEDALSEL